MAKAKPKKERAAKYDEKLEGTFEDLLNLSVTGLDKPAAKPTPKKAAAKKVAEKKD
jgi:hypothetical protein